MGFNFSLLWHLTCDALNINLSFLLCIPEGSISHWGRSTFVLNSCWFGVYTSFRTSDPVRLWELLQSFDRHPIRCFAADIIHWFPNLLCSHREECEDSIGVISFVFCYFFLHSWYFTMYFLQFFDWFVTIFFQLKLLAKARYSMPKFRGEQIVILSQVCKNFISYKFCKYS